MIFHQPPRKWNVVIPCHSGRFSLLVTTFWGDGIIIYRSGWQIPPKICRFKHIILCPWRRSFCHPVMDSGGFNLPWLQFSENLGTCGWCHCGIPAFQHKIHSFSGPRWLFSIHPLNGVTWFHLITQQPFHPPWQPARGVENLDHQYWSQSVLRVPEKPQEAALDPSKHGKGDAIKTFWQSYHNTS